MIRLIGLRHKRYGDGPADEKMKIKTQIFLAAAVLLAGMSGMASPGFATWFQQLNAPAATKVAANLLRMRRGNYSNVKGVGKGVYECKINHGPGYRIYFSKSGDDELVLLGGGIKKRQQHDIKSATDIWTDYKTRVKKQE